MWSDLYSQALRPACSIDVDSQFVLEKQTETDRAVALCSDFKEFPDQ